MATLPTGDHSKYFAAGKPKAKAKATPKAKPWDPFNQPLPSLEAIRNEARQAALADIQALLGALPNEGGIRDRASNIAGQIGTQAQQASDSIAKLAQFGVDESSNLAKNMNTGNLAASSQAGVVGNYDNNVGSGLDINLTGSIAKLLGGQAAATGNILNATAAGTVQGGLAEQNAVQRTLLDQLNARAQAETEIQSQRPSMERQYLDKLKEFYLGIAGSQVQTNLAEQELGLNAFKTEADIQAEKDRLALDTAKFKTNTEIERQKLKNASARLELDAGKLALDQGAEQFNQWYDQQRLEINRWATKIKQGQLEVARKKAEAAGKTVKRPDVNKVFGTIDSMFNQKVTSKTEKVTTQEYIFYAQNSGTDPLQPPVKAFTVRGKDFNDAFTAAKAKALTDGYTIPNNWKQTVGAPGENGYGPAFRNERRNEKTETINTNAPKYTPTQIMNTAIVRLTALGYSRNEAVNIAGPYIQALEPLFNLNKFYYKQPSGGKARAN